MTKIYLMRHGSSLSSDALSNEGKREIEEIASLLKEKKCSLDLIYHSQKVRAKETAEIIAKALQAPTQERADLNPLDLPFPIFEELNSTKKNLLIVSHLPFLATLLSYLLYGDERDLPFEIDCGAIFPLEKTKDKWKLTLLDSVENLTC